MSGQFNKNNFEQNPSNMKKKHKNKGWATNNNPELCDSDVLSPEDIKAIKEERWRDRHISKPTKKELKYQNRINVLEASSRKAPLSKKEEKELKRLRKKYKKEYTYRHANHPNYHIGLKCCLSAIILCVVIVFSAILGGYQIHVRPYTGVSLFELVQLYNGLKNPDKLEPSNFDATADANKFLAGLQDALFLENPIKIQDIMDLVPEFLGGTGGDNASVSDLLDQANEPVSTGSFTGNAALDKLLSSNRFDFSNISTYSPQLEITDKMIGAVLQQVVFYSDNIPLINDFLSPYDLLLRNILRVEHSYIKTNSDGSNTLELTLVIQIHSVVNTFLEKQLANIEQNGTDGSADSNGKLSTESILKIFKPIIDSVLPEDLAIKVKFTPTQDSAPVLGLAAIKNDALQNLILSIDKNVAGGKIEQLFNKVGTMLFNKFKAIENLSGQNITIIGSDTTNGTIGSYKFDFVQTLMSKLNVKNVTSAQFVSMLEHLHAIDNEYQENFGKYLEDYNIKEATIENFNESRDLLFSAYGISSEEASKFTPETFMDNLNTLPELINIKDNDFYTKDNATLKEMSKLSDQALAQIVNQMIEEKATDYKIGLKIYQLQMLENSMNIYASLDVRSFIEQELGEKYEAVIDLMMSLFPENMFVKIELPYERNNASGDHSCNIIFNYLGDSSEATSNAMFETASKLMQSFMDKTYDKATVCRVIDNMIYPLIDEIRNTELDFKAEFGVGGIAFSTAYELLANAVNENAAPEDKVTAEQIQETLVNYYTYDEKTQFEKDENGNDIIKNYVDDTQLNSSNGFISRELYGKFFLKTYTNEENVFDVLTSLGGNLTAQEIGNTIRLNDLKTNTTPAKDMNFAISSLEFARLMVLSNKLGTSISEIGFYENFTFVDMSTDGESLTLVMAGTLSKDAANTGDIIKLENFASKYLVVQATINLTSYDTQIKINNTDEGGIDKLLKLVNQLANSDASFDADKIKGDIGKAIQDALKEFEDQGLKFTPSSNAIDGKDGFTSSNIYKLISEKSIKGDYQEGDDELLRSIIYKLNNLPTNALTQKEYEALNGTDGQFTVGGNTYDLLESTPIEDNKTTLSIYDMYFGQQIKQSLATTYQNIELIKFALLGNNTANINSYKQFVDGLNLAKGNRVPTAEELFPASELNSNRVKVMFLQFKINRAELGANDLAETVIPEFIYGGAFYDLSNPTNPKTYSFINTLNDAEMSYLDRLLVPNESTGDGETGGETGGEEGGETGPTTRATNDAITNKLTDVIAKAAETEFTITFGGQTVNKTIAQLINEFDFAPVIQAGPLYNHCYGMFTYEFTIPTTPDI